jgi:acetate kinase
MRLLVVNTGSSSVKRSVLEGDELVAKEVDLSEWRDGIDAVGHRVVHGGRDLTGATRIDEEVERRIEALVPLAPLHQQKALAAIREARAAFPAVPQYACFDTAFHATLPPAAATYALPAEWQARWDPRRYGFHGLSHAYASSRAAALLGRAVPGLRVVTCHLGAGASLCGVVSGRSVDTTMGFTPLEGLVMSTRAGSVDPGLVLWLVQQGAGSAAEVERALDEQSGLRGLAGTADMREVLTRADGGDERARRALDVYVHRLTREIGAMVASAGGIDVLVFTGGVGERAAPVRARAAERLAFLGVELDGRVNEAASGDVDVSGSGATVRTLVIEAREDLEIARQVRAVAARR